MTKKPVQNFEHGWNGFTPSSTTFEHKIMGGYKKILLSEISKMLAE